MKTKEVFKECCSCHKKKLLNYFSKSNTGLFDRQNYCKKCVVDKSRTVYGVIKKMYNGQLYRSKRIYNFDIGYSFEDFHNWVLSNNKFNEMYLDWVNSGYNKDKTISTDRINDYKGYTFDNIQLLTMYDNKAKAYEDMKNGINNKQSKVVIQYDMDGKKIKEHYSSRSASRDTNISHITSCCNGNRKSAGGYKWSYK